MGAPYPPEIPNPGWWESGQRAAAERACRAIHTLTTLARRDDARCPLLRSLLPRRWFSCRLAEQPYRFATAASRHAVLQQPNVRATAREPPAICDPRARSRAQASPILSTLETPCRAPPRQSKPYDSWPDHQPKAALQIRPLATATARWCPRSLRPAQQEDPNPCAQQMKPLLSGQLPMHSH